MGVQDEGLYRSEDRRGLVSSALGRRVGEMLSLQPLTQRNPSQRELARPIRARRPSIVCAYGQPPRGSCEKEPFTPGPARLLMPSPQRSTCAPHDCTCSAIRDQKAPAYNVGNSDSTRCDRREGAGGMADVTIYFSPFKGKDGSRGLVVWHVAVLRVDRGTRRAARYLPVSCNALRMPAP
jgi:hypothetical protein